MNTWFFLLHAVLSSGPSERTATSRALLLLSPAPALQDSTSKACITSYTPSAKANQGNSKPSARNRNPVTWQKMNRKLMKSAVVLMATMVTSLLRPFSPILSTFRNFWPLSNPLRPPTLFISSSSATLYMYIYINIYTYIIYLYYFFYIASH